jgi:hypothetical protein
MGEPFCNDKKICGYDHFCAPNLPKNSIWTNFSTVLALFLAFFVLSTEFFDTPLPPLALHIWNAQDLFFHKQVGTPTLLTAIPLKSSSSMRATLVFNLFFK